MPHTRFSGSDKEAAMHPTRNDLPARSRARLEKLLNQRLADALDLEAASKQAHWNVRGPNFIALHELFDRLHDNVEEQVDSLAERITALGGTALGTVGAAARGSSLPIRRTSAPDRRTSRRWPIAWPTSERRCAWPLPSRPNWTTPTARICSRRSRATPTSTSGSSRRTCTRPASRDGRRAAPIYGEDEGAVSMPAA